MSLGWASVRSRLSCVLPSRATITYSIAASVMLTTAGKLIERDCLSSRTRPTWKTPGAICRTEGGFVDCDQPASEPSKPGSRIKTAMRNGSLVCRRPVQPNRSGDIVEFLAADLLKLFSTGGELLVDLQRLLGHDLVRLLRSAHKREVRSGGQTFVAVGIQTEAK